MSESDVLVLEVKLENLKEQLSETKDAMETMRTEFSDKLAIMSKTLTEIQVELASQKITAKNTAGIMATVVSVIVSVIGWFVSHLQR